MMHMSNKRTPSSFYGTQWPPRYNKTPSKVVSIPVHFVNSSSESSSTKSEESLSTKIQSVVRGFLWRKSVKKMLAIKVELEEIEKKVNAPETMELMKTEQKEKTRFGESIMNLLLRLDSVRVFHCSALRDFRKSLIKRAIVIQELVDQIRIVGPTTTTPTPPHQSLSATHVVEEENCLEKKGEVGCEEKKHEGGKIEALVNEENNEEEEINCLVKEKGGGEDEGQENNGGNKMEALINEKEEEDCEGKCGLFEEKEKCLVKESEIKDVEGVKMEGLVKEEEEKMEDVEEDCEEDYEEEEEKYESGRGLGENREMLKKMVEDNEKMMEMMAKLFERNEMQTKILTSLTQRVDQLERAFTCDKLMRSRKKNNKRRKLDAKYRQIN